MNTKSILRHARAILLLPAAICMMALASCDNVIYDDEGDCSVTYRIKFRYDKNLKWADAFANECSSVRLYAFGEDGKLAWEGREKGSALSQPGYSMVLELPAGDYRLLAWCGIDNDDPRGENFTVPEAVVGKTTVEELTCRMERYAKDQYPAVSDRQLHFMFHGTLDVSLPQSDDQGGDYVYVMPLTKDTNHIRIILQQLSGEDTDVDQFHFSIQDANGFYACDNSLVEDEEITYLPWARLSGQAGVGKDETDGQSRAVIMVNGAIADLSVGRMMADRAHDMILTITNDDGETVAKVPVIDYALLSKEYYEEAYGRKMTPQEFLDREDEYVLTFFLDSNMRWISSSILIHSWRIVLQDVDITS